MSFFLGIAFDEVTRAEVQRGLDLAQPLNPGAKWERLEKTHVTLVFMGSVVPDAETVAGVAKRHAPFELRLKGGGTFRERVLWLGLDGQLKQLCALQAELMSALEVVDEHGGYTPHVTLARGTRLTAAPLLGFESPPFTVREVCLFESARGAYHVKGTFPLHGQHSAR